MSQMFHKFFVLKSVSREACSQVSSDAISTKVCEGTNYGRKTRVSTVPTVFPRFQC